MNRPRIPDLFTLANLAAGIGAILQADIRVSVVLILAGAVFDFLDGAAAKWLNQTSDIGKQLDSLADMVTFGVAPAIMFSRLLPDSGASIAVVLLIPLCSAWRLAVFNTSESRPWFSGLPTPANALWYVGLALWAQDPWPDDPARTILLLLTSVLFSAWMVLPVRFPALKSLSAMRSDAPVWALALIGAAIPLATGHPGMAINGSLLGFGLAATLRQIRTRGSE